MTIRWTRRAERDLLSIGDFIARDSSAMARQWIDRLRARASEAASAPLTGRVVPELGREDVREGFLRSYRIVYRIGERELHVLTVFEGHRLLDSQSLNPDERSGK